MQRTREWMILTSLLTSTASFAQTAPPPAQPAPAPTTSEQPQPPATAPDNQQQTLPDSASAPQAPAQPGTTDAARTAAPPVTSDAAAERTQEPETVWPPFETLDANADGYINEAEAGENSQLRSMRAELDSDQNGSLSSGEYARGRNMNKTRDSSR